MRNIPLKLSAALTFLLLLACQESDIEPAILEDQDMIAAWAKTNEYLRSSRTESTDVDVTVITYEDDLAYKTNEVTGEYEPINEETITAETHPGGYIFWYAGGGVKSLEDIDFDEASEELLDGYLPFEVVDGYMWALYIPYDFDEHANSLKYDIVYENLAGEVIRLDPKLQVKHDIE